MEDDEENGGGIGSVLLLERVGRVLWCWAVWFGLDMELGLDWIWNLGFIIIMGVRLVY